MSYREIGGAVKFQGTVSGTDATVVGLYEPTHALRIYVENPTTVNTGVVNQVGVNSLTASGTTISGAITLAGLGDVSLYTSGQTITISGSGSSTGGAGATDHGALTGLADDDHTQYIRVDGTRAFTGTVGGVTPTSTSHLATKGYVDSVVDEVEPAIIGTAGVTVLSGSNIITISGTAVVEKEPTGFVNRTDSTISLNESIGLFTISPTVSGGSYDYYIQGTKYTQNLDQSITVSGGDGLHFLIFNGPTLTQLTSISSLDTLLSDNAYISFAYWSTTSGTASIFADERHGLVMDAATHQYLHNSIGMVYISGLNIGSYTITGNGDLDSDAQVALTGGVVADEDLQHTIVHSAAPSANFEQVLEPQAKLPIFYRLGVGGHWVKDSASNFPVKSGTSRIQYNLDSGGTWTAADIANNSYMAMWIAATNDVRTPLVAIMGQRQDNSIADAISNSSWADLEFGTFPTPELRVLFRLIFQSGSSYANAVKARLRDVSDLRVVSLAPVGLTAANDHGALIGLQDDDHLQYILVSGTRAFTGNQSLGGNNLTSINALTAVTGTFTTGITVGNGTTYLYPNDVRTGNVIASGVVTSARVEAPGTQTLTLSGTSVQTDVNGGNYGVRVTGLGTLTLDNAGISPTSITSIGNITASTTVGDLDLGANGAGHFAWLHADGGGGQVYLSAGSLVDIRASEAAGSIVLTADGAGAGSVSVVATSSYAVTVGGVNALSSSATAVSAAVPLRLAAGDTAAAPSYSWTGNATMGMYRAAAGVIGLSAGGVVRVTVSGANATTSGLGVAGNVTANRGDFSTGLTVSGVPVILAVGAGTGDFLANGTVPMTGQLQAIAGTSTTPAWSMGGDTNTGAFRVGDNIIGFTAGAVTRVTISGVDATTSGLGVAGNVTANRGDFSTGLTVSGTSVGLGDFRSNGTVPMTGNFRAATGTASAPSITFDEDSLRNTGFYLKAENVMGMSAGGGTGELVTFSGGGIGLDGIGINGNVTASRGDFSLGLTVSGTQVPIKGPPRLIFRQETSTATYTSAETNFTELASIVLVPPPNGTRRYEVSATFVGPAPGNNVDFTFQAYAGPGGIAGGTNLRIQPNGWVTDGTNAVSMSISPFIYTPSSTQTRFGWTHQASGNPGSGAFTVSGCHTLIREVID